MSDSILISDPTGTPASPGGISYPNEGSASPDGIADSTDEPTTGRRCPRKQLIEACNIDCANTMAFCSIGSGGNQFNSTAVGDVFVSIVIENSISDW